MHTIDKQTKKKEGKESGNIIIYISFTLIDTINSINENNDGILTTHKIYVLLEIWYDFDIKLLNCNNFSVERKKETPTKQISANLTAKKFFYWNFNGLKRLQ